MPNLNDPDFDQIRDAAEGFSAKRAYVGRQAGAKRPAILGTVAPGPVAPKWPAPAKEIPQALRIVDMADR